MMKKKVEIKKYLRNTGCLVLAAVLTVSLGACGRNSGDGGGNDSSLAKQYVYSYEELVFEQEWDGMDVRALTYINDRVYILMNTYGWSSSEVTRAMSYYGSSTSSSSIAVASGVNAIPESEEEADSGDDTADSDASGDNPDTGDAADADALNDIAIEEPAPSNYTTSTKVVSCSLDGSDIQVVELQIDPEKSVNSWINVMSLSSSGKIYAVREVNYEDNTDPNNIFYVNRQELVCWDMTDGSLLWEKSLDELKGESDYYYLNNLMVADDGTIYLMVYSDKNSLCTLDGAGNITKVTPLEGGDFENINTMYMKADGTIVLTSYGSDYNQMYAGTYDPKTGTMGEKTELPGNIWNYSMYRGTNTDFLLTNSTGVYTYNIGDADVTQIMNYINSDLSAYYMQYVATIDQEHFIGVYYDAIDYITKIALFTRVAPEDIPDKQVVVLGVNYLEDSVRRGVIDFNKTNTRYRITVRDYSSYSTMDDYMAGYTKLNNDIISGDMPDILMVDNNMPIDNYIAKGLIADVGRLIEQDEELSQNEYMENVFRAYSVNDKLYYIVPNFRVGTVIGKKSILGDREGWNMEELRALLDTMPEGTQAFGEMTRWYFFNCIMQYCGSDFIDQSTGKCRFDSQEFINMLEFAKTIPEEYQYDYEDSNFWNDYENQYRENRTILMPTSIYQISGMISTIYGYFGEDVNYIGFPNENRNGSVISANMSFVMSSKSKNQEAAWEFVRYYLTDEYQRENTWGMPVKKDVFMEKAREAMEKPFYMDENNKKVEMDYTWYINGEEIIIDPLTQEQLDEMVSFIESVDRRIYYNDNIQKIIDEETPAFFTGQKSAADVAQIIQSRAQIYVNENR